MEPFFGLLIIVLICKAVIDKGRREYRATREQHAAQIARDHPDWHPRKVSRSAGRRALSHWWNELAAWPPFPSVRAAFAEDRMTAKVAREEARADGVVRWRDLHERLQKALAAQQEHRDEDASPAGGMPQVPPAPEVPPLPSETVGPQPDRGLVPADAAAVCGIGACQNAARPGQPFCAECGTAIYAPRPDPRLNDTQRERDADPRLRNACAGCGHPGTPGDPLVVHPDGYRVHESHVTDPDSGLYVPPDPEPPLFDGDPVNPRSPAYVEPPDEEWLYNDPVHDVRAPIPPDHFGSPWASGDPFPEPDDGNWPTGVPHRRNGDAPAADHSNEMEQELWQADQDRRNGGPSPTVNGGSTVTDTQIDTALEGADTPHEAMQGAFRQIGTRAAEFAQAASDELAAAAAVHGMDRDPQTMADIAALADHAQALQAQANAAATGLGQRHAEGAEYHSTGTDANASAYRPS
jgi:hypothetical protein